MTDHRTGEDTLDDDHVPVPAAGMDLVAVGGEWVLLDGWTRAVVFSPTAALIWSHFDGAATVGQISDALHDETGHDPAMIRRDVGSLVAQLTDQGLLTPPVDQSRTDSDIHLEVLADLAVGEEPVETILHDVDGEERSWSELRGQDALVINWSPHCGYCWALAEPLRVLHGPLQRAGVRLVLVSTAGESALEEMSQVAGLDVATWRRSLEGPDPFVGYGTPSAYHLDAHGRLVAPLVIGVGPVAELARTLAGDAGAEPDGHEAAPPGTRYLLGDTATCAPGVGDEPDSVWRGTVAYRLGDHHVGLAYDTERTRDLLTELFEGNRVHDPRAGHSYGLTLDAGTGGLHLLMRGGRPLVRSRSAARVLRSLLWRLDDEIEGIEILPGRLRVSAAAVVGGGRALLLPSGIATWHGLQARLARVGLAPVDVAYPEVDLERAELVVPEPTTPHDPAVLATLDHPLDVAGELAAVGPGRYPLVGWGVLRAAESAQMVDMTVGEAAASTLSMVYEADNAHERLRQLAELFAEIRGFNIWYDTETELAELARSVFAST